MLRHKTFADFVKDAGDYRKSAILVPGAEATDEQRAEYYAKLGRPESAEKYDIKLPDGAPLDEKLVGSFKGVAHQLGLSNEAAQKLTEWYAGQASGIMEQGEAAKEQQVAAWKGELEKEWGWKTPQNTAIAARALMTMIEGNAEHPLVKMLDETGLGNHPAMIKFFFEQGLARGEDKMLQPDQGPSDDQRGDAQTRINAIRRDMKHPYWHANMPGHKEARDEMRMLYDILKAKAPE